MASPSHSEAKLGTGSGIRTWRFFDLEKTLEDAREDMPVLRDHIHDRRGCPPVNGGGCCFVASVVVEAIISEAIR